MGTRGDTRRIMTQKHTSRLDPSDYRRGSLTDRSMMRASFVRSFVRLADDQCWICLDGDTEGREVRDRSRRRARPRSSHRIASSHPSSPRQNARERPRGNQINQSPFIHTYIHTYGGFFDWKKSCVYGTKKVAFLKNISRGDLIVLYMGVRVFTHMGDSMKSLC